MQRSALLADCLLAIEAELRELGWWEQQAPEPAALASSQPFCVDTLRFEQWLQWVLLPRMKELIEQGAAPQHASAIAEMGEVVFAGQEQSTAKLQAWLRQFDRSMSS